MSIEVVTEPAEEPVTVAEAKAHLRVTHSSDDTYISALIVAARRRVEIETSRALVTQTLRARFDSFSCDRVIKLEKAPLQSVTSILYDDRDGAEQTLATSKYSVDSYSSPGRVILKSSETWPSTDKEGAAVRITYLAGYGDADAVPQELKAAMHLLIGHLYANREQVLTGPSVASIVLPKGFEWLVGPYKVWT